MLNKSLFKSEDHHTRTPKAFFDKLNNEFDFTADVSPHMSLLNMLNVEWIGRIYCNPPYNNQRSFIEKCLNQLNKGNLECGVFLLPSRTDTKLFHELILPNAKEIRFIKGRLKFEGKENSAPFPSMVVVFW